MSSSERLAGGHSIERRDAVSNACPTADAAAAREASPRSFVPTCLAWAPLGDLSPLNVLSGVCHYPSLLRTQFRGSSEQRMMSMQPFGRCREMVLRKCIPGRATVQPKKHWNARRSPTQDQAIIRTITNVVKHKKREDEDAWMFGARRTECTRAMQMLWSMVLGVVAGCIRAAAVDVGRFSKGQGHIQSKPLRDTFDGLDQGKRSFLPTLPPCGRTPIGPLSAQH